MIKGLISTTTRLASALFIVSTIAACGGGGGSDSGSGFVSDIFNNPPPAGSTISFEGSGECEALTEVPPIPDTNKAGAYATALAVQTNDFAQSLEEAANSAPDKLTVKLTLPNGSFITETYACRVDRCADDPAQFPDFSPSPPACGQ